MRSIKSSTSRLNGKMARRFHEPVLLVEIFSRGFRKFAPARFIKTNVERQRPLTSKDRFQKFVYKLAHVCAREPGGATVTSIAVLYNSQRTEYVLACNQIDDKTGSEMIAHVKAILDMVHVASSSPDRKTLRTRKQDVLREILLFNKPRVRCYLKALESCLLDYRKQGINDPIVNTALQGLESALGSLPSKLEYDDDYIDTCVGCLDQFRKNKGAVARLSRLTESASVNHGDDADAPSWLKLPHLISRLYSYEEAMACFFDARNEWPVIFQKFDVHIPEALPANRPQQCPLGNKSINLESIIGRMTSDKSKLDEFRSIAEDLRHFNIDARLREGLKRFKPIIHSELLIYDWIKYSEDARNLRFFNGWRFIGASKPTCRLCKYYIESANAVETEFGGSQPIEVRPSHNNIYLNWAFPDALGSSSKVWQETFNRTIALIRDDAFRILEEKSCPGKRHDSNTYDGWSTRASQVGDDEARVSQLSARFGQGLRIRPPRLADESEDEEAGGAML